MTAFCVFLTLYNMRRQKLTKKSQNSCEYLKNVIINSQ